MENQFDGLLAPPKSTTSDERGSRGSVQGSSSGDRRSDRRSSGGNMTNARGGRVLFHEGDSSDSLGDDNGATRNRAELAGLYSAGHDRDPMTLTLTPPATNFLEQPVILGVRKDFKANLPGPTSTYSHATGSGIQDDLLVDLDYKTPSLWQVGIAGVIGFTVGGILNKWPVGEQAQWWMGLIGYLVVLSFSCITLPMVFTSVTICISNLFVSTKTRSVLLRLGIYFALATFLGGLVAMAAGFIAASALHTHLPGPLGGSTFAFKLKCPNGMYFSESTGLCDAEAVSDAMTLTATNVSGLTLANDNGIDHDVTFAAQFVTFVKYFFPENITDAFASSQFLGVTVFSMVVGAAIMAQYDPSSGEPNHALILIKQIHVVLELILNWLVPYIPISIISLLLFCIQSATLSREAVDNAIILIAAMLIAMVAHFFLVVCVVYFIFVRRNPIQYFVFLTPALIYIFATGEYAMTIPVLMRSIEKSQRVSRTLSQFSISLGISFSLCGSGMFYVIMPIFMAYTSGQEDLLTAPRMIGVLFMALGSCFASPPVSGLALTIVCTIWKSLFNDTIPGSFAYAIAMEWLMLRLRRIYNIIIIGFIACIVAEQLDETVEDEEDRMYMDQQLGVAHHAHM